jgi:hypothetical protein
MWIVSHKLVNPLFVFFVCDLGLTGKRVGYLVEIIPMLISSREGKSKDRHILALHQQLQLSF